MFIRRFLSLIALTSMTFTSSLICVETSDNVQNELASMSKDAGFKVYLSEAELTASLPSIDISQWNAVRTYKRDSDRGFLHYIRDLQDPDYGYEHNPLSAIGHILLKGASVSLSFHMEDKENVGPLVRFGMRAVAGVVGIMTIPLTCSGIIVKFVGSLFPKKIPLPTSEDMPRSHPKRIDQVYSMLSDFNEVAKESGLSYFICSGTFLGAVRHEGMIPWDDDGDLMMMPDQTDLMHSLKDKLKARGIDQKWYPPLMMWQLYYTPERLEQEGIPKDEITWIDCFIGELNGKTPDALKVGRPVISFASPVIRAIFPNEYFFPEEIAELTLYDFGPKQKGLKLPGSKKYSNYLARYFGPECLDYGMMTHQHTTIFGTFPMFSAVLNRAKYRIVSTKYAQGDKWKDEPSTIEVNTL